VTTTSNSSLSISNQDATTNNLNFPANNSSGGSSSKQTAEIVNKQLTNGKAPSEKFL
jgi:hypothetical protein